MKKTMLLLLSGLPSNAQMRLPWGVQPPLRFGHFYILITLQTKKALDKELGAAIMASQFAAYPLLSLTGPFEVCEASIR
jgi:hypothetical protein